MKHKLHDFTYAMKHFTIFALENQIIIQCLSET